VSVVLLFNEIRAGSNEIYGMVSMNRGSLLSSERDIVTLNKFCGRKFE
jgi:hypothetical protein